MARRRAGAVGIRLDIEGLEQLIAGTRNFERLIDEVMRDILRGPAGRDIADELRARIPVRSGWTRSQIGVDDRGRQGVEVGITSKHGDTKHPASPRANARSVGVWLESGTRMHLIPTRERPRTRMAFSGRVVTRVSHPGTRARRVMGTTLRVHRASTEQLVVRELERRLGRKIGTT